MEHVEVQDNFQPTVITHVDTDSLKLLINADIRKNIIGLQRMTGTSKLFSYVSPLFIFKILFVNQHLLS